MHDIPQKGRRQSVRGRQGFRFASILWRVGGCLLAVLWSTVVWAGPLSMRLAQFPDWQTQPMLPPAQGALHYPPWFSGRWQMTSTLTALAAPLAPEVVTPGVAEQRQYIHQPIAFEVRFGPAGLETKRVRGPVPALALDKLAAEPIVADQAFNSRSLATAYMGEGVVQAR